MTLFLKASCGLKKCLPGIWLPKSISWKLVCLQWHSCVAPHILDEDRSACDTSPFFMRIQVRHLHFKSVARHPHDTEEIVKIECDRVMLCFAV